MAARLPAPIFTPATKAAVGDHDENISFAEAEAACDAALGEALAGTGKTGAQLAAEARDAAIRAVRGSGRVRARRAASSLPTPSSSSASTRPARCT